MRSLNLVLIAVAFPAATSQMRAEASPSDSESWLQKWQDNGLSVHQAFDGSKNESKPAAFSYLKSLYTVDVGAKLLEWDPLRHSSHVSLPIGPSIEWHDTNVGKEANTITGKVNLDCIVGQLRGYRPNGKPVSSPPGVSAHDVAPIISLKIGLGHDVITHTTGGDQLASVTFTSNKNYYPNAITVDREGRHLWRYAPSVGLEHFGKKDIFSQGGIERKDAEITFARARISAIAYPLNANMEDRNEISADYTYRWRVGGQAVLPSHYYLSLQATHYFDKMRTIGVGVEYDRGRDPNQKFQELKQGALVLRFGL